MVAIPPRPAGAADEARDGRRSSGRRSRRSRPKPRRRREVGVSADARRTVSGRSTSRSASGTLASATSTRCSTRRPAPPRREVIEYYARIAPVMLPHLAGRCITFKRFPDGVEKDGLLREAVPEAPARVGAASRSARATATATSATAASTSRRRWCGRRTWRRSSCTCRWRSPRDLETPRAVVFDFDPGAPAADASSAARSRCGCATCSTAVDLQGWCKTSGSKGLQLYVPLNTPVHPRARRPTSRWPSGRCSNGSMPRPGDHHDGEGRAAREDLRRLEPERPPQDHHRRRTRCGPGPSRRVSTPVTWDEVDGLRRRRRRAAVRRATRCSTGSTQHGDLFAPVLTTVQELPVPGR